MAAKKKTTRKKKNPGGRPTPYKPEFAEQAYIACKDGGFSDKKLAELFGVCRSTINNWRAEHKEFRNKVIEGKDFFNCNQAEASLNKRIKGYRYTETTQELFDNDELKVTKKVSKYVPPDVPAIKFFLVNRARDRWKERVAVDHSGKVDLKHEPSDEMKDVLNEVYGQTANP